MNSPGDSGEVRLRRMLGVFTAGCILNAKTARSQAIGELGISGAGAAVAKAVFNATGIRIRDDPITLDKVLLGMERRA